MAPGWSINVSQQGGVNKWELRFSISVTSQKQTSTRRQLSSQGARTGLSGERGRFLWPPLPPTTRSRQRPRRACGWGRHGTIPVTDPSSIQVCGLPGPGGSPNRCSERRAPCVGVGVGGGGGCTTGCSETFSIWNVSETSPGLMSPAGAAPSPTPTPRESRAPAVLRPSCWEPPCPTSLSEGGGLAWL